MTRTRNNNYNSLPFHHNNNGGRIRGRGRGRRANQVTTTQHNPRTHDTTDLFAAAFGNAEEQHPPQSPLHSTPPSPDVAAINDAIPPMPPLPPPDQLIAPQQLEPEESSDDDNMGMEEAVPPPEINERQWPPPPPPPPNRTLPPTRVNRPTCYKSYQSCLRHFMCYKNKINYPKDWVFSIEELSDITPECIYQWMAFKTFGKEDPSPDDNPTFGMANSLLADKKKLSYFMVNCLPSWDVLHRSGNPTKSAVVNDLISFVKKRRLEGRAKNLRQIAPSNIVSSSKCWMNCTTLPSLHLTRSTAMQQC